LGCEGGLLRVGCGSLGTPLRHLKVGSTQREVQGFHYVFGRT
jgi:hypothetical protein